MALHITLLLIASLAPPFVLLWLVHRLDRIEPEPDGLLLKLFVFGVLGSIPVIILEILGERVAGYFTAIPLVYLFISYFILPGFIEEGMKFAVLRRTTWRHSAFNYRFDAVVYSVFASLGFAAIENVLYVFSNGFAVAIVRAIMAIPAHTAFGIIMGVKYGEAKSIELAGNPPLSKKYCRDAWLLASVAHGLYDFLLVAFGSAVFFIYFAALIAYSVHLLRSAAKEDCPVNPYISGGEAQ